MRRDLLKTASFAAVHFAVAFTVAYALTGSVAIAAGLGLLEPLANTVAYFLHERLWARIDQRSPRATGRGHAAHRCAPLTWRPSQT
jgi:uncharacterized membrane protein